MWYILSLLFSWSLLAQNTYYVPNTTAPGKLVRIEVSVYDDQTPGGVQIESVTFNGSSIPLKPRDIHAYRGAGSFQILPGVYKLRWVVRRDKVLWPRTVEHEEVVTVDPKDLWLQITIEGENAKIE